MARLVDQRRRLAPVAMEAEAPVSRISRLETALSVENMPTDTLPATSMPGAWRRPEPNEPKAVAPPTRIGPEETTVKPEALRPPSVRDEATLRLVVPEEESVVVPRQTPFREEERTVLPRELAIEALPATEMPDPAYWLMARSVKPEPSMARVKEPASTSARTMPPGEVFTFVTSVSTPRIITVRESALSKVPEAIVKSPCPTGRYAPKMPSETLALARANRSAPPRSTLAFNLTSRPAVRRSSPVDPEAAAIGALTTTSSQP